MKESEDYVLNAIKRKYASDIASALRRQSPMELQKPVYGQIKLALTAESSVLWDKQKAEVVVEVRSRNVDSTKWLGCRQVLSQKEISSVKDTYALADYLIEGMRNELAELLILLKEEPTP